MECPKCHKSMKKLQWNLLRDWKGADASEGYERKTDKAVHKDYERTLYVCEEDDLWVTVEQPASSQ